MRYLVVALIVLVASVPGCNGKREQPSKRLFFRMDTMTEVTISSLKGHDIDALWKSVDSILQDWEQRFSQTHDRSEVRRLNERSDSIAVVSPQLAQIVATALAYGDSLQGMFDVTILPVKELWGLGEHPDDQAAAIPDSALLAAAVEKVDYTRVKILAPDTLVFASKQTRIDVGGIAKGFVIRAIAQFLDSQHVEGYLISAGGDIFAKGKKPDGTQWLIGIQHPRDRSGILATLPLDSGAVVTSGDYERYRMVNGTRYHHIFDPSTGVSCGRNQSVTIRGADPVEVDILSTGLFCRDAGSIIEYVEARPRLDALVVDSAGALFVSSGWRDKIKLQE